MCPVYASVCHEGHRTFFGSMARFYCKCAFGIAGGEGCMQGTCAEKQLVSGSPALPLHDTVASCC